MTFVNRLLVTRTSLLGNSRRDFSTSGDIEVAVLRSNETFSVY
jgi:hypothetical protein